MDPSPAKGAPRERHTMPADVSERLRIEGLMDAYAARPPYQRNDYLGWMGQAKRPNTREKRLQQMLDELRAGDKYMKMDYRTKRAKA